MERRNSVYSCKALKKVRPSNRRYMIISVSLWTSLNRQWKKGLSKENSWISYAADHMYWLLFFFAALISIAGYCAAKRRMRNYRDEEDEQEKRKR